ncbi:hypothetical protein [Lacihabitans sp. LS3-19]|uniref:hypothetical protein n=1 Tax=Lacihabitans sp. LS3-19 TaxID=2487335 RepID=UPI0020CE2685|nr:hypothetical protein [Lacihabitans sp. LS3-19]
MLLVGFLSSCEKEGDVICMDKVWYQDLDKDGKGNPIVYLYSCKTQPAGFVDNADDANDLDPKI